MLKYVINARATLFLSLVFCALQATDSVSLFFEASDFATLEEIHQSVPEPFLLETLTFDTNAYFDSAEFTYLLGFKEGDVVSAMQLKQALDHLQLKHRFEEIEITLSPCVIGKHLHLRMRNFWALEKLHIYGWVRGKEKYRALYLIEPGERFEELKHAHSIKKIKDSLHADGYLGAQVISQFFYDYNKRTMCVDLTIKKGKRFLIQNGSLVITSADATLQNDQYAILQRRLYKKFIKPLKRVAYSKALIQDQTRAIAEYLNELGYFSVDVRAQEIINLDDITLDLDVTVELADKRAIFFLGNHFFTAQELRERLFDFGRSAWLVPAEILSEEIANAYYKKGFWFASIHAVDERDRYLFVIDEGVRVKIDDVIFRGAKHLEVTALKKAVFTPVLTADFYDEKLVAAAVTTLRTHYQRLGYIDASIVDYTFQERDTPDSYALVVTVDEGACWLFKKARIPQHPELEAEEPFIVCDVPFNSELLEAQRVWLTKYFTAQGYSAARVMPELEKDAQTGITVRWLIEKGPQAQFGKTVIVGTSSLPFNYIARELQYREGDVWNPEQVKKTFLRLKELEIFDSIQLHQAQICARDTQKTMVLKLLQDDLYEVRLRAGAELQYIQEYRTFGGLTYKFGGSFLAKNPFNRADLFRLDADFVRSHFEFYASYRQPWLFSIPLRTMVQAYAIKHDQPGFVGNTNNLYRLTQYGALINIGRPGARAEHGVKKTDYLDAGLNLGFEWMETKLNEPTRLFAVQLAQAMNFDIRLLDKQIPYFLVEPTLLLDFVDNNLYPHKGSLTLLSAKGMIPLRAHESSSFFIKLLLEQSVYIPIDPVVLALRLRVGHIFYQEFSAIMPSERFYLGGSQSIRSYNTDLAPPLGVFCDDKGKQMIVPRGGKTMINGNAEIRIPLPVSLEGVLFQDLGMLSCDNFATFCAKDILAGTGFGLRLKTPIGPLRFDFGFKWQRDVPLQPGWAWSLMFGNAY